MWVLAKLKLSPSKGPLPQLGYIGRHHSLVEEGSCAGRLSFPKGVGCKPGEETLVFVEFIYDGDSLKQSLVPGRRWEMKDGGKVVAELEAVTGWQL
jgi:hypothetical protein